VIGFRRIGRQCALQMLFSEDGTSLPDFAGYWEHLAPDTPDNARPFAEELVRGVHEHVTGLDATVEAVSTNWQVGRMSRVDRSLLRLAVYELRHTATPAHIVVNEAVELAKEFGANDSGAFVHGVLAAISSG
jgi:N utilization substance protein B